MKVVVNSVKLSHALKDLKDRPEYIRLYNGTVKLKTVDKEVNVNCIGDDCDSASAWIPQDNARWDWVSKDLNNLSERPIVLEFSSNRLNVILSY